MEAGAPPGCFHIPAKQAVSKLNQKRNSTSFASQSLVLPVTYTLRVACVNPGGGVPEAGPWTSPFALGWRLLVGFFMSLREG